MSVVTREQMALIQRGWLGAATAVAPNLPGVPELLESRLDALRESSQLVELELLKVVEDAGQLVLTMGTPDLAREISKRLRRTVYEFLLALDAGLPEEVADAAPSTAAIAETPRPDDLRAPPATAPAPATRLPGDAEDGDRGSSWLQRRAETPMASDAASGSARAAAGERGEPTRVPVLLPRDELDPSLVAPRVGFHLTDPEELVHVADVPGRPSLIGADEVPAGATPALRSIMIGVEETESPPTPGPGPETARSLFADISIVTPPPLPLTQRAPWEFPRLPAAEAEPHDDAAVPPSAPAPQPPAPTTVASVPASPDDTGEGTPTPAPLEFTTDAAAPLTDIRHFAHSYAAVAPPPANADNPDWRIRRPGYSTTAPQPIAEWDHGVDDDLDPTEAELSVSRAEIEILLKRRKFDQAGAILQQLAQESGGRAVAELALDVGDHCRASGKRMAATSCYLAASRSDPVFEEPLSRLADICIDDKDTDLAVSYLERIARLTRLRGDVKGALRIYRKIHVVAPYRDDILELLMRAQTTGRLD